jgi:hypothetical protein
MTESRGYGPSGRLLFDGDSSKYEQWETKFFAYMRVKEMRDAVDPESHAILSQNQKEKAYAELIQLLDDRSLNLVMRDGHDDGRASIQILRDHYAGTSECRILSLITTLATMSMSEDEDVTDYIIRCESAATSLAQAGEPVSDRILNAMVLKGLPSSFKQFRVFIEQKKKVTPFLEFKRSIRSFEENERAANIQTNKNNDARIMRCDDNNNRNDVVNYQRDGGARDDYWRGDFSSNQNGAGRFSTNHNKNSERSDRRQSSNNNNKPLICFACEGKGHRQHECPTKQRRDGNQNGASAQNSGQRSSANGRNNRNNSRRDNNNTRDRTWCAREENNDRYDENEVSRI